MALEDLRQARAHMTMVELRQAMGQDGLPAALARVDEVLVRSRCNTTALHQALMRKEAAALLFGLYADADGNGILSAQEYANFLKGIGAWEPWACPCPGLRSGFAMLMAMRCRKAKLASLKYVAPMFFKDIGKCLKKPLQNCVKLGFLSRVIWGELTKMGTCILWVATRI